MTTVHTDKNDISPGPGQSLRYGGPRLLQTAARFRVELVIAAACVLVELLLSTVQPAAISSGNITNIAQTAAPLVIIALGQLLVITTAGIDLSVGSVFSLTGIAAAALLNHGAPTGVAVLGALGLGALFGLFNGVCVAVLGLAPFIVTLVTYSVAASLAFVVTNGNSQPVSSAGFGSLNSGHYLGIPNYLLYVIVLVVLLQLLLSGTTQGRWLYAVGSNERAARLIGVPVRSIKLAAYTASGLLAAFAAVLSVSYLANAESTAGTGLELQAIAAVVIGGASLFGGVGSAVGALTGAVLVVVIQNAVNLLGVNSFYQGTITGLVILLAVLAERLTRRSRTRGA
ncbi:ABC transporter permease [Streptomyces montanus]|uniref:ABC transporter permease n=1 Tax=Streptomyces montanus TaxID=2580423 RepID=UPI001BB29D68|nr:ABC transporter permease [Streptomyces montanus]